jgi:hypothetical protein
LVSRHHNAILFALGPADLSTAQQKLLQERHGLGGNGGVNVHQLTKDGNGFGCSCSHDAEVGGLDAGLATRSKARGDRLG